MWGNLISTFHIHNFGIELYHSLSYAHLFLLSLVEYLHENHIMNHLLVIVFILQKSATRHKILLLQMIKRWTRARRKEVTRGKLKKWEDLLVKKEEEEEG